MARAGRASGAGGTGGLVLALAALTHAGLQAQAPPSAESCAALAKLTIANVTVTSASFVAAGAMPPPPARGGGAGPAANPFADLPAMCRVAATLRPSTDSDIKMELWLPVRTEGAPGGTGWNGKFRGTGNGGLGGAGVNANALANGVRRGYATAGHNTGH